MTWGQVAYGLACVVVPVAWGLVVVWGSNRIDRRLFGGRGGKRPPPPIEYHI